MAEAQEKIILSNWSPNHPVITSAELGWRKSDYLDAMSRDPEIVFNYFWHNFNSIVFYYPKDGNFYELFMEGSPFKFWKVPSNPEWDGKWIVDKISWNEHEEGEVLFTFNESANLWSELKVDGKSIGDVIKNSIIAEINI